MEVISIMRIDEYDELNFSEGKKKITIKSIGYPYPNDTEQYLKELQNNLVLIESDSLKLSFEGSLFTRTDLVSFKQNLIELIENNKDSILLESDEEDFSLSILRKKEICMISIRFYQINYINEKWSYEAKFNVSIEKLKEVL